MVVKCAIIAFYARGTDIDEAESKAQVGRVGVGMDPSADDLVQPVSRRV